jgi:methionyl-tRNA formyltransferase
MRLIFMGSPDFSVPVLDALVAANHDIAAVYCQPPRPAGRGKKERLTAVHTRALELGLEVRHPASLKTEEAQKNFASLAPEVAVVVAYGLILPQAVLDTPTYGCLNIHASLLPRWRGAAPIHRAIMAGDAETGVCIMQMEAGLDTGPVLLRESTPIGAEETTLQLHNRLSSLGAKAIVKALETLPGLTPSLQTDEGVTYAEKIRKDEARIDWTQPAEVIDRQIRGLSPFPGAWCELEGARLKILASRLVAGSGNAGEIINTPAYVACGSGAIELLRLQKAGSQAQDISEFIRGTPLPLGTRLT